MEYFRDGCSDVNKNKKKSKFVKRIKLFALEKKKTYTSMMAPPGALFFCVCFCVCVCSFYCFNEGARKRVDFVTRIFRRKKNEKTEKTERG